MKMAKQIFLQLSLIVGVGTLPLALGQDIDPLLIKQAPVVFVGSILQHGAVSFEAVPLSELTAVVRVHQVLEHPRMIAMADGDTVTLLLKEASLPAEGAQVVFYCDGWIVGQRIGLKELGHTVVADVGAAGQIKQNFLLAKQQVLDEELRTRIAGASIVGFGTVVSIRPAEQAQRIVTEHDPEWQEAIVEIRSAIKGTSAGDQVVVRFPGSMDVAFYRVPKLKPGDEKIILAVKDTTSGLPRALLQGKPVEAYLIESPADVLPKEELQRVQRFAR